MPENRLHEAAHLQHGLAELFVGLGIELGVTPNLAHGLAVIVHPPQVVAVQHRREGAVQGKDFETVPRKIEVADDFRPQQRDHVRAHRELEAREDLFRNRGAAEDVTTLQHQDLFPCSRQICGVDQAVVPAADDDGIVFS